MPLLDSYGLFPLAGTTTAQTLRPLRLQGTTIRLRLPLLQYLLRSPQIMWLILPLLVMFARPP